MPEVCLEVEQIALWWQGPTYCSGMSVEKASDAELALWDEILKQKGLSMEAGRSDRIDYGAKYFDSTIPHDYQERMDNYMVSQVAECNTRAQQLMAMTAQGMSVWAAAKKLGIDTSHAYRTLKRHRANFEGVKATQGPTDCSSEEEDD